MIYKKVRIKISVGFVFKDINVPDTYFDPHNVIHDIIVKDSSGFNVPLAHYINTHYSYGKPIPFWIGDYQKYSEDFKNYIECFRDYFSRPFNWKGRKVLLIPVEKCPWVYAKIGKLVELEDEVVVNTLWGILTHFQSAQKDFVFSVIRPIIIMKDTFPYYPFKVTYDTETEQLTFIYPNT